jgi:hypothetical protein
MATEKNTATIHKFSDAKAAQTNARCAAFQASRIKARPLQGKLLRKVAAGMSPTTRGAYSRAIAEGFAAGRTTLDIVSSIERDLVRQAARSAL